MFATSAALVQQLLWCRGLSSASLLPSRRSIQHFCWQSAAHSLPNHTSRLQVTMISALHLQHKVPSAAAVAGTHRTHYCSQLRPPSRHTSRTTCTHTAASASDQPPTSSSQQFSDLPAGPWSFGFQCNERCARAVTSFIGVPGSNSAARVLQCVMYAQ